MANTTKYTREKAEEALAVLQGKQGASVAAHAIGVSRETLYKWRKNNEWFRLEWDAIQEAITDELETSAIHRALSGESDTMLIFMLKSRRRETYGDKQQVDHSGNLGIVVSEIVVALPPVEDGE